MGRKLSEPPSVEGVLQEAAVDVVRGRIAVAAGCAIVGFCAALGWPRWSPAPFLIGALLFALATLLFAVASHRVPAASVTLRVVMIALLLAHDTAILVAIAILSGERAVWTLLLAPLVAALLTHARALVRIVAVPPGGAPPAGPAAVAAFADPVCGRAREAIGIVRARAEALRLAAADAGVGALLGHDLDVLVRQAEECQRVLRELEEAQRRAAGAGAEANFASRRLDSPEEWPSESTPLRS